MNMVAFYCKCGRKLVLNNPLGTFDMLRTMFRNVHNTTRCGIIDASAYRKMMEERKQASIDKYYAGKRVPKSRYIDPRQLTIA